MTINNFFSNELIGNFIEIKFIAQARMFVPSGLFGVMLPSENFIVVLVSIFSFVPIVIDASH